MEYEQGGMSISMSRTPKKRNKIPYWKQYLNIKTCGGLLTKSYPTIVTPWTI